MLMQQIGVMDGQSTASQNERNREKCETAQHDQHGITSINGKGRADLPSLL